ncbi:BAG family molecular chaperone regulator 2-like [Asterias rubens]|uniref:BAG family molecular chaperone regulator 2-like n=1 Tax=Asterias rubens TaxID=7604 RepID=UPI001454FE7E|nr:BAG family molecular chaperone regulator 2-like [Asterias rubens]
MSAHGVRQGGDDGDFLLNVLRSESPPSPGDVDGTTASQPPRSSPIPGLSATGYGNCYDTRGLVDTPSPSNQNQVSTLDDFLLTTLDEMESRTEKLRETVKDAVEERTQLLGSLDTLMQSEALGRHSDDERQELEIYMDRLIGRLLTIDISVQIVRSIPQEQSLQTVRTFLIKLRDCISNGVPDAATTIQRYLNSCMEEAKGPVDDRFQGALLGCAAEDQKEIRKKLGAISEAREDTERQMSVFNSMDLE